MVGQGRWLREGDRLRDGWRWISVWGFALAIAAILNQTYTFYQITTLKNIVFFTVDFMSKTS